MAGCRVGTKGKNAIPRLSGGPFIDCAGRLRSVSIGLGKADSVEADSSSEAVVDTSCPTLFSSHGMSVHADKSSFLAKDRSTFMSDRPHSGEAPDGPASGGVFAVFQGPASGTGAGDSVSPKRLPDSEGASPPSMRTDLGPSSATRPVCLSAALIHDATERIDADFRITRGPQGQRDGSHRFRPISSRRSEEGPQKVIQEKGVIDGYLSSGEEDIRTGKTRIHMKDQEVFDEMVL
jgi:hypothetical protein